MRCLPTLLVVVVAAACSGAEEPRNGELVAGFGNVLYVVDPDDRARQTIPDTEGALEPIWSQDGDWIAFTRQREVGSDAFDASVSDLYVMRPDGTDQRLVARNARSPAWSPDGTRIVFVRDTCVHGTCPLIDNPNDLFIVEVETETSRRLTSNGYYDGGPSWSPDGDRIVFESEDGLFLMRPDGTDVRRLTRGAGALHWGPSWSPDGKLIAYADPFDVYVVGVDGDRTERLTENEGPDFLPAWSPDGTKIAYLSNHVCAQGGGCTAHELMHLRVMNRDGTQSRALTDDGDWRGPSWGPQRDED